MMIRNVKMDVELRHSLYSVLILRRLFMDYGITTTARVTPPEDEFMNDESNTSLFSTSDTSSTTYNAKEITIQRSVFRRQRIKRIKFYTKYPFL